MGWFRTNGCRAIGPDDHARPAALLVRGILEPGALLRLLNVMQSWARRGEIHPPTTPAHTTHPGKTTPQNAPKQTPHTHASQTNWMRQPSRPVQGMRAPPWSVKGISTFRNPQRCPVTALRCIRCLSRGLGGHGPAPCHHVLNTHSTTHTAPTHPSEGLPNTRPNPSAMHNVRAGMNPLTGGMHGRQGNKVPKAEPRSRKGAKIAPWAKIAHFFPKEKAP